MPHWNSFSTEVAEERHKIRSYGKNLPAAKPSYKAQALRELAKNQILEQKIKDLEQSLAAAVDLLDGVSDEDIVRFTGFSLQVVKNKKKEIFYEPNS
jgi:hypothetical protein